MQVTDLVEKWNNDKGPFGNALWCDITGCSETPHAYVQSDRELYFLCRKHYKEFTYELAYPRVSETSS